MTTPDTLPLGFPFTAGEILVAALRAAPALEGITIQDNPIRAASLKDGTRVIWLEDVSDGPAEQGQQVKREYRFSVGVINRTDAARRGVHTDYRAVKRVLDAALPQLRTAATVLYLREGDLAFVLENIDVGGGLILASFSVGYRDPNFRN